MELIDKAAVIAEIERRISNHNKELQHASDEDFVSSWASDEENQKLALIALIPFLNTLEVKEVDLEKEIQEHINECLDIKFPTTDIKSIAKDVEYTARKFFELGLKAKGK